MKIILELEVDFATGTEYERLNPEIKERLNNTISRYLEKTASNLRLRKLKKLLRDIRKEAGVEEYDPEVLYALVRKEAD